MRSTKILLLGVLVTLFGIAVAQPPNEILFFRAWTLIPPDVFTNVFPIISMIIVVLGLIIGFVGFFQKDH